MIFWSSQVLLLPQVLKIQNWVSHSFDLLVSFTYFFLTCLKKTSFYFPCSLVFLLVIFAHLIFSLYNCVCVCVCVFVDQVIIFFLVCYFLIFLLIFVAYKFPFFFIISFLLIIGLIVLSISNCYLRWISLLGCLFCCSWFIVGIWFKSLQGHYLLYSINWV